MLAMKNRLRILRNFFGLALKLSFIPYVLYISPELFLNHTPESLSTFFGTLLILMGLYGMVVSDLLILRFGDGNLHFSTKSTRLVDVGFYARTRHPFFWFFSIYQYGVLLIFFGFSWLILILSVSASLFYLLWLLLVQESLLTRSLGERYLQYKNNTPFWHWKIKLAENLRVGFRPQLVWLIGMLVIRFWYRIRVEGSKNIPHDRPFLIVANHESYIDPFLFGIFVPFEIKFVTTADVFNTPLMRFLLKGTGGFPMRRHRQDLKSIRTMIRMIGKGQVVCIFPEGGRSTDGSPLPILKETLKLIQHCKVPILPVHIEGAYEIWPRWAPNRRRGSVTASFKPIIALEAQHDLGELETQIAANIFAEPKTFRAVSSHSIAKGMNHLLWACYKCHTRNSIKVVSGNTIRCQHCATEWLVSNDYHFTTQGESKALTSIQWIELIKSDILEHPLKLDLPMALDSHEQFHLQSPVLKYLIEEEITETSDLSLILSNQRVILLQGQALVQSWSLASITIFTMDYFNAVSIGVGGVRHSFKLPESEITLKWQTYFDTLKSIFEKSSSISD
ncbi:MAG: 1-acyl-sn-glycerol-3-phosphate acyltransferase [Candidatus Marinimicrobia bacterium]|nr:1-acyl-sn-glycerol-3-phosphate acyltransferase [Candidatus Neomarinimicrobiota bacterium]